MSLPATDDFTGTGDVPLSSNWTVADGLGFLIRYNEAYPATGSGDGYDAAELWNADTFDDDQYSEATIVNSGGGGSPGVACRMATGGTLYRYNSTELIKIISGENTYLATGGAVFAVDDVVRLECEGTTITPMIDGSEETQLGAQTDSAISSGAAGLGGWGLAVNFRIDDWEGGNLGGGGGGISVPVAMRHFRNLRT